MSAEPDPEAAAAAPAGGSSQPAADTGTGGEAADAPPGASPDGITGDGAAGSHAHAAPVEPSAARDADAEPDADSATDAGAAADAGSDPAADAQRGAAAAHTEPGAGADTDSTLADGARDDAPAARRGLRSRGVRAGAAAVVVAAVVAAAVVAAGHSGGTRHTAAAAAAADGLPHTTVDISPSACGRGWSAAAKPHPGTQVFDLHNSGASASEVYLEDPRTGRLYAEVEGLAPGAVRQMLVNLGSGTYAFECQQEDTDSVTGPSVEVPGHVAQGPSSLPVTVHDLIPPTLAYQKWIQSRMADLTSATGKLRADIDRGDLAAARRDWLTGHLVYERMGAAYDTFGDADGMINGTAPLGGDPAKADGFTGFHRIEYGLWHGESAVSLRGQAKTLDDAARKLRSTWKTQQMDPANMGLRAHEIVENTLQFELTGRTDYGSGTNLATALANIDGSREILAELEPLLKPRDSGLARLEASMARARTYTASFDHGGRWTPLDKLTRAQRERLDADFGDLLEQLAPVAAIFDVRRTV